MSRRLINYRSRTPRSFRQDLPEERPNRETLAFSATPMSIRLPAPRPADTAPVYGRRLAVAATGRSSRALVTA